MTISNVGGRLLGIRKALKLGQAEFAARLETSSGYISEVENNKSVPGGKFLLSLNREFGTDINWFLNGDYPVGGNSTQLVARQELLTEREYALLDDFRALGDKEKDAAETMLHAAAQPQLKKA